jgi:PAB-dependent poly(A)-specific ribonuclease subunit 2
MTFEIGLPPPQIEEEVLRNMKTIDFVGYAPNPGTRRRNQVVRRNNQKNVNAPKFRSQQALELLRGGPVDEGEDLPVRNLERLIFSLYEFVCAHTLRTGW